MHWGIGSVALARGVAGFSVSRHRWIFLLTSCLQHCWHVRPRAVIGGVPEFAGSVIIRSR